MLDGRCLSAVVCCLLRIVCGVVVICSLFLTYVVFSALVFVVI